MWSELFPMSESISGLGNFYGIASVDMSPDVIWNTGSVWLVWHQTCQTGGVLLMLLILYSSDMETFFQPSIDCIVEAVKEQQRTSQSHISATSGKA
jgi:hypothetical protein